MQQVGHTQEATAVSKEKQQAQDIGHPAASEALHTRPRGRSGGGKSYEQKKTMAETKGEQRPHRVHAEENAAEYPPWRRRQPGKKSGMAIPVELHRERGDSLPGRGAAPAT